MYFGSGGLRILITGGAGFIGSHLADDLLQAGHSIRVLDSLSPQVHGQNCRRPSYLSRDAELIVADIRSADAVRGALHGMDAVFHFAAAVGVGQSMYQVDEYVSVNEQGTANLLQCLIERPVQRLIVASSMSIYGEGLYRDAAGHVVEEADRSAAQLKDGVWEPCGIDGNPLQPMPTPESKRPSLASVYALNKYAQERMCLMVGRAYGIRHDRVALLQRLWHAPGAFEPLHWRSRDLRLAAAERPAAADLRGRRAAAGLRPRARRRARLPLGAADGTRRR